MRELERLRANSIASDVDTITIESPDVNLVDFASNESMKKELFLAGYNASKKFYEVINKFECEEEEEENWDQDWG